MRIGLIQLLTSFCFLILLASCQVEEGSSELVSGHVPTSNSFTLQSMTSKTYVDGESIGFSLTFPFDIILDTAAGTPRLRLTIGSTTKYASFIEQPNPRTITFNYDVVAADNDMDGITLSALELNSSTMKFDHNGTIKDCNVASISNHSLSNIKIDNTAPTITGFLIANLPGLYNLNDKIYFTFTFSEDVYVTNIPKFSISLNSGALDVEYELGSGTDILKFSHTVTATDSDTNGFSISSPIIGTIKDSVGNSANLDFSSYINLMEIYSATVKISGDIPHILDVTAPTDGTYLAAQNLDFKFTFDREVNVPSGSPYIEITIGNLVRQAYYLSGSGTDELTFRYTTVPGDVDEDGIELGENIIKNSSDITAVASPYTSYFSIAANNEFPIPDCSKIILNAIQPQVISVARNFDSTNPLWGTSPDNTWIIGQELNFTLSFNTPMYVVQTGGTPYLSFRIGATEKHAAYHSGGNGQTSLIFRYVIQEGDLDSDGTLDLNGLVTNGGIIYDANNTNTLLTLPIATLSSTKIDGVRPTISNVDAPDNQTYSEIAPYNSTALKFVVTWSEAVSYGSVNPADNVAYLNMVIGGETVRAEWKDGSNSTTFEHWTDSLAGKNDSNGISLTSPLGGAVIIRDQAGNACTSKTFSPPVTSSIYVDTTSPTVQSVTPITSNGSYKTGSVIEFSVLFSESVTVVRNGSYPRIPINIGGVTKYLVAAANGTGTTHTFSYTVQSGDSDTNGVSVGTSIQNLAGTAYARDAGRNYVAGTFTPPSTPLIKIDTTAPPAPTAVASSNGSYVSGDDLQIAVTYNEIVNVDETDGTPFIVVDFDNGTDNFSYVSGSGTSTLIFKRTLGASHFDMTGLPSSITSITLNDGAISDIAGNSAATTFASEIDMSQVYITYPQVVLWLKKELVNIAPTPVAISGSTGLPIVDCGIGKCAKFNGTSHAIFLDDSLQLNSLYLAFTTPGSLNDYYFIDSRFELTHDIPNSNFDITTQNATIWLNEDVSSFGTGTIFGTNFLTNQTNVLRIDFQSTQFFFSGDPIVENPFSGAIGEIIAISGSLDNTQKENIRNYLNQRY